MNFKLIKSCYNTAAMALKPLVYKTPFITSLVKFIVTESRAVDLTLPDESFGPISFWGKSSDHQDDDN